MAGCGRRCVCGEGGWKHCAHSFTIYVCAAGVWFPRIHAGKEGWVAKALLERRCWGLKGLGVIHRLEDRLGWKMEQKPITSHPRCLAGGHVLSQRDSGPRPFSLIPRGSQRVHQVRQPLFHSATPSVYLLCALHPKRSKERQSPPWGSSGHMAGGLPWRLDTKSNIALPLHS